MTKQEQEKDRYILQENLATNSYYL